MNGLLYALFCVGGSATLEELRELLDHRDRRRTGALVREAAELGLVVPPGVTGRRGGIVELAPSGVAFLLGRLKSPEIQRRIKINQERFEHGKF